MENFRKEFLDNEESFRWRKWVFDENGITIEEKWDEKTMKTMDNGRILHCFCPYGNIKSIDILKSCKAIRLTYFYKTIAGEDISISSDKFDLHDMKVAVKFAQKQSKKQKVDFDKFQVFKTVTENKFDNGEYIMQCEICGQVFRYTDADIKRNREIEKEAQKLETHALIDAIGYNPVLSSIDAQRAENKRNTKVDYYSCPKCHSKKLKRITKEELDEINGKNNPPETQSSNLDEIKKLKELLDLGAITEEEFNSKKKELLGL